MDGDGKSRRFSVVAILFGAMLFGLPVAATVLYNREASEQPSGEATVEGPDSSSPVRPDVVWAPAVYRGLTVGLSNRTSMIAALGDPLSEYKPKKNGPSTSYSYRTESPIPGVLSVIVDDATETIESIRLRPSGLTMEELVELWGDASITTRYDIDGCLSREEKSRLYECEDGPIVYTEYREQGIAVSVSKDGEVQEILYVDSAIGSESSRCGDPPIVVAASVPFYPDMARRARIGGVVRLRVTSDGERVTDVETISGPPLLEFAARENVRTWQFQDGRTQEFEVTFHYILSTTSRRRAARTAMLDFPYVVEVRATPVVIDTRSGCRARSSDEGD